MPGSFSNYGDQFPSSPRVAFARAWAKWQTACEVVVWPSGATVNRIVMAGDDVVVVQGGMLLVRR